MLKRFFMTALLFAATAFAGLSAADPGKLGIAAEQKKDCIIAAMLDTAHARVVCGSALLIACTALNVLALIRSRKKECDTCG